MIRTIEMMNTKNFPFVFAKLSYNIDSFVLLKTRLYLVNVT